MKKVMPVFNALSEPVRLKIVHFLAGKDEASCQEISDQFELSQPSISHHTKILNQAGIITCRKEGTRNIYALDKTLLMDCGIDPARIAKIDTAS